MKAQNIYLQLLFYQRLMYYNHALTKLSRVTSVLSAQNEFHFLFVSNVHMSGMLPNFTHAEVDTCAVILLNNRHT